MHSKYHSFLQLLKQLARVFEQGAEAMGDLGGELAVDEAVVEGEGDVEAVADGEGVVEDGRGLLDAGDAADGRLGVVDDRGAAAGAG